MTDDTRDDVARLFSLPLKEFTDARNALAATLKKAGRPEDAARVKALAKPSISAWAVNQLYWTKRRDFDRLVAAGEGFLKAQIQQLSGEASDLEKRREERRESMATLLHFATAVLTESGNSLTPDVQRRIATTLEAISITGFGEEPPGQLTGDLAPPGFEALAALVPTQPPKKAAPPEAEPETADVERIKAVQLSLREAEQALSQARTRQRTLELELETASKEVAAAERRVEALSLELASYQSKRKK
jgi:hypothetical protein